MTARWIGALAAIILVAVVVAAVIRTIGTTVEHPFCSSDTPAPLRLRNDTARRSIIRGEASDTSPIGPWLAALASAAPPFRGGFFVAYALHTSPAGTGERIVGEVRSVTIVPMAALSAHTPGLTFVA